MIDTKEISPKPTRSLYDLEEERAVPCGDPGLFAWHRSRYAFALPLVSPHFRRVALYGQSIRASHLHVALKAADVLNLRHRLVRSTRLQRSVGEVLGKPESGTSLDFRFSRLLVRQSPHIVLVACA